MKEETIYNEEVYHTGNGQEELRHTDYMDPETGESVPNETVNISHEEIVATYMKKCNFCYHDDQEKNKDVNFDCLNT